MTAPSAIARLLPRPLLLLLATALAARVCFLVIVPAEAISLDLRHWQEVAAILQQGKNPYELTTYLNWPPLWMQIIGLLADLSAATGIAFERLVQALLIAVEQGLIVAAWHLARRMGATNPVGPFTLGLALNPIPIFLVCQHCNFDVIVALFVVLALLFLLRFREHERTLDWHLAATSLGLGILAKTIPVVLAPLLVHRGRRLTWPARALGLVLLLGPAAVGVAVIYSRSPAAVTRNVFAYRSFGGYFGFSGLAELAGFPGFAAVQGTLFGLATAALLAGLSVVLYGRRRMSDDQTVLLAALLLVWIPTFGSGYGPQYAFWSLPLLVVLYTTGSPARRKLLIALALVAVLTFVVEYALAPPLGAFLLHLLDGPPSLVEVARSLHPKGAQTLLRLPLFLSLLAFVGLGARAWWRAFETTAADQAQVGDAPAEEG